VLDNGPVDDAAESCDMPRTYQGDPSDKWIACTDRLCLRLLRPEDAVSLREVVDSGWVAAMMAQYGDRALSPWAVVLRDGGEIVGHCGFFVRPVKGTTMGYAIVPQYRGRGLATEAAAAVLGWAEQHDINVYASVRPPNPASVRVLEKIGMRLVDSYFDEDGQRDIYRR
jgi:RimJ/RimL family protein N-acetyltransferase